MCIPQIRTLRFQLTRSNKCNLNCFYCCKEGCDTSFSVMNDENVITSIRACKEVLNIERVKYTGGEPLLYGKNIINVIDYIDKEYNKKEKHILQSIVTNGVCTGLIKEIIDKKYNIDWTISLPTLNVETFEKITGSNKLQSVLKSIDLICNEDMPLKINCVLIKGINTQEKDILDIINYFNNKSNVKLRFLNLIDNKVTNLDRKYIFSEKEFDKLIKKLKFKKIEKNEKRSSSIYNKDGFKVKLIKFFCSDDCIKCPGDKTSIWVTSEGEIKKCSFDNIKSYQIKNWTYEELCKDIYNFYS